MGTRFLTKKAIAEMTAYEMAGLMVFANVAAEPLVDKVVIKSVYGSGLLILLMMLIARLALVNRITQVVEHTATIIIQNGQIDFKQMKRLSLSLNQLLGLLRQQGYDRVSEVQAAIFEPQGSLSVFPKAENKPVTLKDMKIPPQNVPVSLPLILDGKVIKENLKYLDKTELWLMDEVRKQGIIDYRKQVVLAELDSSWNVTIYKKA
jgi:uncharacterized membrane protein YcaP (DUF421 family)